MEDPIVKLLDGTTMPKSQVPLGTVYYNENGMKVKKVAKAAPSSSSALASSGIAGGLLGGLMDMAQKNLPSMAGGLPLDKITSALTGMKSQKGGLDIQSVLNLVQGLSGSAKSGNISGLASMLGGGGIDISQVKNIASSLNIPGLDKVMGIVEGIAPNSTPRQQFDSYLKLALQDGVITDDEEAKILHLGKEAGLSQAEIAKIIKANI